MRWTVRFCLILVIAWIVYAISPYVALYRLSRAIEHRNVEEISEHINFRALRLSLTKQLVGEYLDYAERTRDMNAFDKKLATEAGATVADPLIAQLLTPATLVDLLDDGWPQQIVSQTSQDLLPMAIDLSSLRKVWRLFAASESHGFRMIYITVPGHARPEERYRLQMRLNGLTWRLSGLDLPTSLRQKLVTRLPAR